jgi:hypothetical protein
MDKNSARNLVKRTFENPFDKGNFIAFSKNLLKSFEPKSFAYSSNDIPENYKDYVISLERIGQYIFDGNEIDLLIVTLKKETSLERARTMQRNFVAWYLKGSRGGKLKDAALVAFISPDSEDWRFSLVKMDYRWEENSAGRNKVREEFTPAKRWSFLVGKNEKTHTVQSRFLPLLEDDRKPTLEALEDVFSVEPVTEEFFEAYKYALDNVIVPSLPKSASQDKKHSFAQLLLSRIIFVYFLQRKGWFKWKDYIQDKNYLKNFWRKYKESGHRNKFYSSWLSSLFFGAFNKKSSFIDRDLPDDIKESLNLMPFLNGGLFSKTELDNLGFDLPDSVFDWLFEEDLRDKRKGFLETFNFTIDESLPLDMEVAVDPEVLGKVYESLINEEEKSGAGIFYTPRVEIDLMCRLSLVEYLGSRTNIEKSKIVNFIFNPHNSQELTGEEVRKIKSSLDSVKIVDPAVGSASFLVSFMNILVELHCELSRILGLREENIFSLKQRIILENLYGVDVKDWAVMVGELRLWLSLILETEEKYMDIYTKPLLPNLSFKIRQGDSLVQEIADTCINLKGTMYDIPSSIRKKIRELIDRKRDFFSGRRSADLKEVQYIEKLEQDIFIKIIRSKIDATAKKISTLDTEIKRLKDDKDLWGIEFEATKADVAKMETERGKLEISIENYKKILSTLGKKTEKDYFLWELDFLEVFAQNGGFDIVIGNPPYVRQELIAPPLENQNDYTDEEWRELKKQYKEKLIKSVQNLWNGGLKIDRKSDLYVYFYYLGLSLLKPNGVFCFINSNSWLDVGYGAALQEFLLKRMHPLMIIDNLKKRSFKQADVNTVIVLIKRPEQVPGDYSLKFVAFKKPFEDVISAEVINKIYNIEKPTFDDPDFRLYPKARKELLLEGVEVPEDDELALEHKPENLPYVGNKWGGKYLRAPEIYFKILEKGKDKLVRLGDIAEVRFGIKTGANEFFYLKPVDLTVKQVVEISKRNPDALIRVRNGAGWEGKIEAQFLKPVIKSPKELKTIVVRVEDLNFLVFMCHRSKRELKGTKALEYIIWGEKKKYHLRPTCRSRERWWDLGSSNISSYVWSMTYRERFFIPLNKVAYADARFYDIFVNESIGAILNSTYCLFLVELQSRGYGGGGGPVDVKVYEVNNLLVPEIKLSQEYLNDINRPINSIFLELGFDPKKPIRDQDPNPLPDRKALDGIVFDALGLTEEERKEVYWAVAELVKNRLEKARSI